MIRFEYNVKIVSLYSSSQKRGFFYGQCMDAIDKYLKQNGLMKETLDLPAFTYMTRGRIHQKNASHKQAFLKRQQQRLAAEFKQEFGVKNDR